MIYFILIDILLYSITTYKIPTIILGIPLVKDYKSLYVYLIILSFFEWKYILMLLIIYIIILINKFITKRYNINLIIYILLILLYYFLFYTSMFLIRQL